MAVHYKRLFKKRKKDKEKKFKGEKQSLLSDESFNGKRYVQGKEQVFFIYFSDLLSQTHGYPIPEHIQPYMEMIDRNATKILYFAMCGQHE